MPKEREVISKSVSFDVPEYGMGPIEPVEGDKKTLMDKMELEAFMNELVEIVIPPTADINRPAVPMPSVNAITKPIVRGVRTWVRRKFVEVLARNKGEDYKQVKHQNEDDLPPMMATKFMRGMSMSVDPFFMITDKNPKGQAWLEKIQAEAR